MMKERPILFSAPMVRAILAGAKTQTRRVVKPQPQPNGGIGYHPVEPYQNPNGEFAWVLAATGHGSGGNLFLCPYGQPGDRLWVRETWGAHFIWDDVPPSEIPNDGKACLFYVADGFSTGGCSQTQRDKWRPSIHMPRWASRILLEIVSVRVERLQDINEADAVMEGLPPATQGKPGPYRGVPRSIEWFHDLWESINGPGSWDANPWVWAVEFKRIDAEGGAA